MRKTIFILTLIFSFISSDNVIARNTNEQRVRIETKYGNIIIRLYDETPRHRDNFIKLIKQHYYDSLLFHRVIKNFMIQTGDPDSKNAPKGKMLGTGSPGYTIQPEFNKKFTHVKGAVAAARLGDQMNPGKESSGSQFYIVVGNTVTDESLTENEKMMYEKKKSEVINRFLRNKENANTLSELQELKAKNDVEKFNAALKNLETKLDTVIGKPDSFRYTDEQRKNYIRHGGTPHLDMDYTVFGEIVEGFDVIDKLSSIETDSQNRPIEDIRMKIIIDK